MKRRPFLTGALASGLGFCLGSRSRVARAGFGDTPPAYQTRGLPRDQQVDNVLEVFLYGGVTTWESFYAVEDYGLPTDPDPALRRTQLYTFYDPAAPRESKLLESLKTCGQFGAGRLLAPFAKDALGKTVNLGPYLQPLRARADVLARMRMVVTRHNLEPHEAAVPLALCGRPLGNPAMASLGAHVQQYRAAHGAASRRTPFSYVLATNDISADNLRASTATGVHPGTARPLMIHMDGAERLTRLITRPALGSQDDRRQHDALVRAYAAGYAEPLTVPGGKTRVRAHRLDELLQASAAVAESDGLVDVLDPKLLMPIESELCGDKNVNAPVMSLRLAAHLLTHPTEPASYCCFVDGGLLAADGGGGYDTHAENPKTQARNLKNTFDELMAVIRGPNDEGPDAAGKIDLDRTQIILNMEFGRSPGPQGDLGRNHWPYGYVTVYIGGVVREKQRGIFGAIGPDGKATTHVTPAEHRIAALLGLGIWPFSPEAFGVSDVEGARNEGEAADSVLARVWGHG